MEGFQSLMVPLRSSYQSTNLAPFVQRKSPYIRTQLESLQTRDLGCALALEYTQTPAPRSKLPSGRPSFAPQLIEMKRRSVVGKRDTRIHSTPHRGRVKAG